MKRDGIDRQALAEFVSVIIPCRNEVATLSRCLDSILLGSYPADRMEVLVIDGGSSDGTRELIDQYRHRDARVRLLDNPQRITPCALNLGIDAARGSIIARIDAHARVAPDYLEKCVGYLLSTGADNVGGSMRTVPAGPGLFAPAIVTVLSHRFGVGNSRFRTLGQGSNPVEQGSNTLGQGSNTGEQGSNTVEQGSNNDASVWVDTVFGGCWRRPIFDRIGRFNPRLRRSQDMEFSRRLQAAGGRTLLVPSIRCDYYARTGFGQFCRHNFANGQWAILPFLYSEVVPVSLRHLIPLCFASALLAGGGALLWTPWPLALVAGSYLGTNLLVSAMAARKQKSFAQLLRLPIVFSALHLSYGAGSIAGILEAASVLFERRSSRIAAHRLQPGARSGKAPANNIPAVPTRTTKARTTTTAG